MTVISEQTIDLGSCAVHALACGPTSSATVVLLHGMKFQAETWRQLGTLEFLAGMGQHVLAVDMPGFGRSPASEAAPVAVLARLFEHLAIERVTLIGPSMGGRIALEFSLNYPQRIAGLVLVGAVGVEDNRSGLGVITAPTLIVWGGEDQVSPLGNSDILLAGIKGATREIYPGAPHPCYLEQPDRWHASLRTFFTRSEEHTSELQSH